MQSKFIDDVSETAVSPVFTGRGQSSVNSPRTEDKNPQNKKKTFREFTVSWGAFYTEYVLAHEKLVLCRLHSISNSVHIIRIRYSRN
jgi:hypothetical protein